MTEGVRLTEAQREWMEWAASCGGVSGITDRSFVNRLHARGLVQHDEDAGLWTLTDKGRAALKGGDDAE